MVVVSAPHGAVGSTACISDSNPLVAAKSYFPASQRIASDGSGSSTGAADVVIAGGFSVHYDNHFKLVKTHCGKYQDYKCKDKTYVLTLCGADKPTTFANGTALPVNATHFSIPLAGVSNAGGAVVSFLDLLGLLGKIKVVDPKSVHSPCLQKAEVDGTTLGVDKGNATHKANWTKMINEQGVTGVLTDSWGWGSTGTDLDIVVDGSSDAAGVLGRAEWIKFVSLFFNEEEKANLYFKNEHTAYKGLETKANELKAGKAAKTCAWIVKDWSGNYELNFKKYKMDLCKSAGLTAAVDSDAIAAGQSSFTYPNTAAFHAALATFDVVIDETYSSSPQEYTKEKVLESLNITGLTKPGAILLRADGHVSDDSSSIHATTWVNVDFYESAIARPALVLEDLMAEVWGTAAPPAGCSQYFRNVIKGEMPVVNAHTTCGQYEAAKLENKCITRAIRNADIAITSGGGSNFATAAAVVIALLATLVL